VRCVEKCRKWSVRFMREVVEAREAFSAPQLLKALRQCLLRVHWPKIRARRVVRANGAPVFASAARGW